MSRDYSWLPFANTIPNVEVKGTFEMDGDSLTKMVSGETHMTAATFEASLFEHLTTLFSGSSTVRDFRHWFNNASWESDEALPDSLYELASDIEHLGYIRNSGVWDDGAYLQNLRSEVDAYCSDSSDRRETLRGTDLSPTQLFKARVA